MRHCVVSVETPEPPPGGSDAQRCSGESGFTLIEAVVALSIAAVVFMALGYGLVGTLVNVLLAQQNQQSGDILNQYVERARSAGYDDLAMRPADLATNDALNTSTCNCYNPMTDTKSGATELLALDANGVVQPHVTAVTQNGGTYSVRLYVTLPTDNVGAAYKRVTVVISWTSRGRFHQRTESTIIAATRRGLPLPDYKFTPKSTTLCRNPGSDAVYAFDLTNNGARDAWTFSTSPMSPTWTYFNDTNDNGVYDAGSDASLGTEASNGLPSTGLVEPKSTVHVFAFTHVPDASAVTPPYTWMITFTATSVSQPTYSQSHSTSTSVTAGSCGVTPDPDPDPNPNLPPAQPADCGAEPNPPSAVAPGGTVTDYWLHNGSSNRNNTTTQAIMPFDKTSPLSTSLWNYSTDWHSVAGRYLNAPSGPGSDYIADWRYQLPATSELKGQATLTLWAAPDAGLASAQTFTFALERLSSTGAPLGVFSNAVFSLGPQACSGLRRFTVSLSMPNSGQSVGTNEFLKLTVKATGTAVPMVLAYDTTMFVARLQLPVKSGSG